MTRQKGAVVLKKLFLLLSFAVGSLFASSHHVQAEMGNHLIMGDSTVNAQQMAAFVTEKNPSNIRLHGISVERLAELYLRIGQEEGVRGDVAFAQAIKETGYFAFGGDVRAKQHNFAGIGATGGGARGNSFATAEKGVYAQIQHLKAYASTEPLKTPLADPRFKYVKRGIAPTWPDLHKKWAMQPTGNYGEDILSIYEQMSRTPIVVSVPLEKVKSFPESFPVDLNEGYWAEEEIIKFLELRIIDGVQDDMGQTFIKPNDFVTRAQFVKMLVQAFKLERSGQTLSFKDVQHHDWFAPYVDIAASLEITTGSNGAFKPNERIKRDQMAAMISRTISLQLDAQQVHRTAWSFHDVSNKHWAYSFISHAASAGIIRGYEDGTFRPSSYATRAQAIVMTYRLMHPLNK
jgi:hypothetical protein